MRLKLKTTAYILLIYTLLFCVLMAGIFALFIAEGRSFVNHADAYDQGYFWTAEMGNNLKELFSGEGYPLWSWDRGTGLDTKLPIDPFLIIASLFPGGQIEFGYTLAIVLRLYFAGIAFILFCMEVELDEFKSIIGALCYVSSTFTINVALVQGQFIDLFILFPLLVMSVDRIYKGKSSWPFMLTVGITVAVNYYLAFMAAIGIVIYIIFRYFRYHEFEAKEYFSYIGRFIVYGIVGIMLSAVFVLVTIRTLSGASTGARPDVSLLYDTTHYYKSVLRFVSEGYTFGYKYIGIPILAILALPVVKGKPTVKATHVIMSIIMLLMAMSPLCGSMFNAFGYITNRWYFMLIFFLTWCAAEHLDLNELSKKKNVAIMLMWWALLVFCTLGFSYLDITGNMSMRKALFVGGNLAAGLGMIIVIVISPKLIKSLKLRQGIITFGVIATLIVVWNVSFYGETDYYFKMGEINRQLEKSTQRAGSLIEDNGFYRIDQMDWINAHIKADQPVNENLWWQNNTIYLYDSKIPYRLSEFNKLLGNNMGYSKRVYVQSNGNRMGLDFLYGVKYYLGDDLENGRMGADGYAGYAFDFMDELDGVRVFKSRYDSSLGFMYDKYILESEFEKLSRLEREQALLQALVVPDDEEEVMDESMKLSSADIETDISDVSYEIVATDEAVVEGNRIITDGDDSSVTIHVDGVKDAQMVVSFDNLRRLSADGRDIGDFKLKCRNGKLRAEASNGKNNQTIPGIVDYDLNMGYYDEYSGDLTISFSKPGIYEFDKLCVSAMAAANFDKYAAKRCESVFKVDERDDTLVSGSLDAKSDGYLFLSIPVNASWNVFIDDAQVAEIHNANIAFFATPVTKGMHKVEIRYDYGNRHLAAAISAAGLILMISISLFEKKRKERAA